MKVARVFPRLVKNATPQDDGSFVGLPQKGVGDFDRVDISVTFTKDLPLVENLEREWRYHGEVYVGGPALNDPGAEFVPGKYLKPGFVITSRGCPNNCWYCSAWKREGRQIRELPITEGFNVLDNNLLACSSGHIEAVFSMLKKQGQKVRFTGGLDARLFLPWHADRIAELKPEVFYFAYDRPELDAEPLRNAADLLRMRGMIRAGHQCRAYVLCGYKSDKILEAIKRLQFVASLGIMPMAMFYNDGEGLQPGVRREWKNALAPWIQPRLVAAMMPRVPRKGKV